MRMRMNGNESLPGLSLEFSKILKSKFILKPDY